MKITKLGYRETGVYSYKCPKCDCEFEWTSKDLEYRTGLNCPCCGVEILYTTIRMDSGRICEPYTKDTVYSEEAYQKYMEEKNKDV